MNPCFIPVNKDDVTGVQTVRQFDELMPVCMGGEVVPINFCTLYLDGAPVAEIYPIASARVQNAVPQQIGVHVTHKEDSMPFISNHFFSEKG